MHRCADLSVIGGAGDRRRRRPHSVDGRILQEAGSVIWRDGSGAHVREDLPSGSGAYGTAECGLRLGERIARHGLDSVGGFDERYFPTYIEDVDLGLALAGHGFRTRYEPLGTDHPPGELEHPDRQSGVPFDPEPAEAGREMGSGPRALRAGASEGLRAGVRRRSGAGDQAGRRRDSHSARNRWRGARRSVPSDSPRPLEGARRSA